MSPVTSLLLLHLPSKAYMKKIHISLATQSCQAKEIQEISRGFKKKKKNIRKWNQYKIANCSLTKVPHKHFSIPVFV